MGNDDRQRIRLGRTLVDEVDIQSVDLGLVVVERIQLLFLLAPVVLIAPVRDQFLQLGDVGPVLPTVANLVGKPRPGQPSIEIFKHRIWHGDLERPDGCWVTPVFDRRRFCEGGFRREGELILVET